jgi:peptidoglycan hydrolase CwlO-like protein
LKEQLHKEKQNFTKSIKDLENKVDKLEKNQFSEAEVQVTKIVTEFLYHLKTFVPDNFNSYLSQLKVLPEIYPHLNILHIRAKELGLYAINKINHFEDQKKSLESRISDLNNQINTNNTNFARERQGLNNQIASLNSQINNLRAELEREREREG